MSISRGSFWMARAVLTAKYSSPWDDLGSSLSFPFFGNPVSLSLRYGSSCAFTLTYQFEKKTIREQKISFFITKLYALRVVNMSYDRYRLAKHCICLLYNKCIT